MGTSTCIAITNQGRNGDGVSNAFGKHTSTDVLDSHSSLCRASGSRVLICYLDALAVATSSESLRFQRFHIGQLFELHSFMSTSPWRILLCSSSMSGGGSERQLLNLLRGLDRKRFQPMLYLLYREGELLSEVPNDVPIHAYWERHQRPKWNWPGRIHRTQVADLRTLLMQQQIDVTYDRLFHMAMLTGPATRNSSIARVSTIVSPPSRDLPIPVNDSSGSNDRYCDVPFKKPNGCWL